MKTKTKEEILEEKLDSLDYNINRESLTAAMQEYADQQCIEFVSYLNKKFISQQRNTIELLTKFKEEQK
jgi:hypothetical protein